MEQKFIDLSCIQCLYIFSNKQLKNVYGLNYLIYNIIINEIKSFKTVKIVSYNVCFVDWTSALLDSTRINCQNCCKGYQVVYCS